MLDQYGRVIAMGLYQLPPALLRRRFIVTLVLLLVGIEAGIFAWEYRRNLSYQRVDATIVSVDELARRKRLHLSYELQGKISTGLTDVSFLDRRGPGESLAVMVGPHSSDEIFLDEFMYRHQFSFGLFVAMGFLGLMVLFSVRRMARIRAELQRGAGK